MSIKTFIYTPDIEEYHRYVKEHNLDGWSTFHSSSLGEILTDVYNNITKGIELRIVIPKKRSVREALNL